MGLPVLRVSCREVEKHGVARLRINALDYVRLALVAAALGTTEKRLCRQIVASGVQKYPPPPALTEQTAATNRQRPTRKGACQSAS